MDERLIVLTTMPDREGAISLAKRLVEQGLAACVNIGAEVTSIYRWEGELQQGNETTLTIKSSRRRYAELERQIARNHPYELPEIVAVPITAGLEDYLAWIDTCTNE